MNLKKYEKIEALLSAIEDQSLRLLENNALTSYYEEYEQEMTKRFQESNKEQLIFLFKEHIIRWKFWLMDSSNIYLHNQYFYKNRLEAFLETIE
jgi:hypothetical protein